MMSVKIQKHRILHDLLPDPVPARPGRDRIVLLTGARQTGKTTLAKLKYPQLKYVNLDAPENREFVKATPSALWGRDIGKAVIDEAQKEPEVFDKIKYSYDEGRTTFSVLLGSSQILLMKKIRESLAGRVSIYELWPLMMSELCSTSGSGTIAPPPVSRLASCAKLSELFDKLPPALSAADAALREDAEKYLLKWGGMPALLPLSDEERWKWLRDYEYTYLERDLADLARLDDLGPFRKFQKLAALRSGGLLNYSELARDASVSVDTARRYLEYLKISYQVTLLQPYYKNITSSSVKTPKIYWVDTGLSRQLSGFTGEATGQLYETMVFGEMIKWIKTAQAGIEPYFYRTKSGLELDMLLQTRRGVIGVEIKNRGSIGAKDLTALKNVGSAMGKDWIGGMLIYRGDAIKKAAEPDIWAVPSRRLFAA